MSGMHGRQDALRWWRVLRQTLLVAGSDWLPAACMGRFKQSQMPPRTRGRLPAERWRGRDHSSGAWRRFCMPPRNAGFHRRHPTPGRSCSCGLRSRCLMWPERSDCLFIRRRYDSGGWLNQASGSFYRTSSPSPSACLAIHPSHFPAGGSMVRLHAIPVLLKVRRQRRQVCGSAKAPHEVRCVAWSLLPMARDSIHAPQTLACGCGTAAPSPSSISSSWVEG